jgi:hypothetical protein
MKPLIVNRVTDLWSLLLYALVWQSILIRLRPGLRSDVRSLKGPRVYLLCRASGGTHLASYTKDIGGWFPRGRTTGP